MIMASFLHSLRNAVKLNLKIKDYFLAKEKGMVNFKFWIRGV